MISEVKGNVIRVLLTITRHSDNDSSWYLDWLGFDNNITVCGWLNFVNNLSKSYFLITHIWMIKALSYNVDIIFCIHGSIRRLNFPNVWIIVVKECIIWNWEWFSISWDLQLVEVITSFTISKIKNWRVAIQWVLINNGGICLVSTVKLTDCFSKFSIIFIEVGSSDIDLSITFERTAAWINRINSWNFEISEYLDTSMEAIFTIFNRKSCLLSPMERRRNTL
jgi:hypothetical protein